MARGDLTEGRLLTQTLRFGSPLALAMFGHGLFNLVDMMIVGAVGPGACAAVTVPGILLVSAFLLLDGVNGMTSALVAEATGERRPSGAVHVFRAPLRINLVAAAGLGFIFFFAAPALVDLYRMEDPALRAESVAYFRICAAGLLGMFILLQATSVLRGLGESLWPMGVLIGANLLNLLLDWLLIYGVAGFPRLGVSGAAWATVISQALRGAIALFRLLRGHAEFQPKRVPREPDGHLVRQLLFKGLPASLQLVARAVAASALIAVARSASALSAADFLDGVGVCVRLEMVVLFLGLGWASAATTVVGQNLGARLPGRAVVGTWWIVLYAATSMSLMAAALWHRRGRIPGVLLPSISPRSRGAAETYLAITLPFLGLLAVALVISRALNGAKRTILPCVLDWGLYGGAMLLLAKRWSEKPHPSPETGAWWAAVVIHTFAAGIYTAVFLSSRWLAQDSDLATVVRPDAPNGTR